MKMHDGGLMAFLNPKTQEKAQAGNAAPDKANIVWIDARELVRNEKNFYGIRDIEELAALIAASGTIEPLTVTPTEDGKYRIVAGERRTAATILRLERGDIIDPKVPCIVMNFSSSGALSAEEKEMLCLIASNRGQRQTRTALEQLREIEELEPIAKKIKKEMQIQGTFRDFFASQILSISPAKLQRLKSLAKLVDEGRAALDIGMISESAAVELASHSEEDQYEYLKALVEDNVQSRAEDIKIFFQAGIIQYEHVGPEDGSDNAQADTGAENIGVQEETQPGTKHNEENLSPVERSCGDVTPEEKDANDPGDEIPPASFPKPVPEKKQRVKNSTPASQPSVITINIDLSFPDDLSGDKAEHKVGTLIESILADTAEKAQAKINESRVAGDKRAAAFWELLRAEAVRVLEKARE